MAETGFCEPNMPPPETMNVSHKRKRRDALVDSQQGSDGPRPKFTYPRVESCEIDKSEPLKQDFTEGPARFTLANDGYKDCIALLVPETFINKLADLFDWISKKSAMEGPLYHARMNARNLEVSLQHMEVSLEAADTQESVDALRRQIGLQEIDLRDIRRRLKQLEEAYNSAELELGRARFHTEYILDSAMEAADLLRPPKPTVTPTPPPSASPVDPSDDDDNTGSNAELVMQESVDPNTQTEPAESPEELARQQVLERLDKSWHHYARAQAQFDNRKDLYDQNLAEYQRRVARKECLLSRSDFDRKAVVWGRQLTGALIYAEAVLDKAQEDARALKATRSTISEVSCHESELRALDEFGGEDAGEKRRAIDAWAANVIASSECSGDVEVDEWDSGTVEMWDSVSAVDYETHGKQIVRWQDVCAKIERPKEALWKVREEPLTRRQSI